MLHFQSVGKGSHCILFLHGFMESSSMWKHLKLTIPSCRHIYIDLPGHGHSTIENVEDPSIAYMADECLEVLKMLGVERYSVIGHSMGGYVALEMKDKDPCCEKVVLLNSNFWEDPPQKKVDRIRVADLALKARDLFISEAIPGLFYRREDHKKEISNLIVEAKRMHPEAIAFASLAMRSRSAKHALIQQQPSDFLIIHGENDPLITREKLFEELGGLQCSTSMLDNAGHMAHIEAPNELSEIVIDFLKE